MPFIVGYITKKEKEALESRGWEVENAQQEYNLVGNGTHHIIAPPDEDGIEVGVVFVDNTLFEMMSGPGFDREQAEQPTDASEAEKEEEQPSTIMTTDEFWNIVEKMGWGRGNNNYTQIKNNIRVLLNFDVDRIEAFHTIYRHHKNAIYNALDHFQLGLGDDSYGDFCSHIVGLGREEYEAVIDDPEKGKARAHAPYGTPEGFVESFTYAVPSKYDMEEIEWSSYIEWADRVKNEYDDAAMHPIAAPIHDECVRISQALALVTKKKCSEFLNAKQGVIQDLETIEKFHNKVSLRDLDIDNPWAVKNLFTNLENFGLYLR